MKKISLLLILFYSFSYAQIENLENEIRNYSDSTEMYIRNARNLLIEHFSNKNSQKIKEISNHLNYKFKEQDNYIALLPYEKVLLEYWNKNYNDIPLQVFNTFYYTNSYYNEKNVPQKDILFPILLKDSKQYHTVLIDSVNTAFLRNIDKEFLKLTLYRFIQDNNDTINQEFINNLSDSFIEKYPLSEYDTLIRKYYRYKTEISKWGYGVDLSTGYGILNEDLSQLYSNPLFVGIGFDVSYKNFILYIRDEFAILKKLKSQTKDDLTWEKDEANTSLIASISLGYNVYETSKIKWTPFTGYSALFVGPTQKILDKKPEFDSFEHTYSGYCLGFNTDFNLKAISESTPFLNYTEKSNMLIKFRYTYNFMNHSDIPARLHTITLSFGGFGRRVKRKL